MHLARLSQKILLSIASPVEGDGTLAWTIAEEWYRGAEARFKNDPVPE